jgi:hypothetical protein
MADSPQPVSVLPPLPDRLLGLSEGDLQALGRGVAAGDGVAAHALGLIVGGVLCRPRVEVEDGGGN